MLDLAGPLEALDKANQAVDEPVYSVRVVAAQAGPLRTSGWVSLDIAESYRWRSIRRAWPIWTP